MALTGAAEDARREAALAAIHRLLGPFLVSLPRVAMAHAGVPIHPFDVVAALSEQLAYAVLALWAVDQSAPVEAAVAAVESHVRATVRQFQPAMLAELARTQAPERAS